MASSANPSASGSGDPGPIQSTLRPASPSKAIGSLAKKQTDVTRQGTQKLKFVPTIPPRRKKDGGVKQEQPIAAVPNITDRGGGRGRGRGRGDGRGAASMHAPLEMTASGPFAMGPALAGQSGRRSIPRSNFTPIATPGSTGSSSLGAGLSGTRAPALSKEKGKEDAVSPRLNDEDEYSDPDEGVEIVDMENVRQMDWAAPESLRRDRNEDRKKKTMRFKKEVSAQEKIVDDEQATVTGGVNLANALDLSESEEEEELEDLIKDFALQTDLDQDSGIRQERLYFFQFPTPFPTFLSKAPPSADMPMNVDVPSTKKVTFAPDSKPPPPESSASSTRTSAVPENQPSSANESEIKVDGIIGQLEVHQSGAVKMRLGNGIVMDVTAATQPCFLQHAAYLDIPNKRLSVLGEVNKRFVVSPNVEALLSAMDFVDHADPLAEEDPTKMDTT